jgi:hypothetical protein
VHQLRSPGGEVVTDLESLPWQALVETYVAGDKQLARRTVAAVKDALAQMLGLAASGVVSPDNLQPVTAALTQAIWDSRMLAVAMEENLRRMHQLGAIGAPSMSKPDLAG